MHSLETFRWKLSVQWATRDILCLISACLSLVQKSLLNIETYDHYGKEDE